MKEKFKKFIKKYQVFISVLFFSLLVFRNFWGKGTPLGHDIGFHMPRMANFFMAIKDLHFPMRWAKNLNYKFGYPAFNFYYSLGNYIALPFFLLTNSIEISYELSIFVSFMFGFIFLYLFLKKIFSAKTAFLSSLIFFSSSSFMMQIFVRQAFGEIIAWLFFPFTLWATFSYFIFLKRNEFNLKYFFLSIFSIFLLSHAHNIIFIFGICIILVLIFWELIYLKSNKKIKILFYSLIPIILGFTLSFYYFIPMLLENKYTVISKVDLTKNYYQHFISFDQLLLPKWDYGDSTIGLKDNMPFNIGIQYLVILIIFPLLILISKKFRKKLFTHSHFFYLPILTLIIFLSSFLMTSYSSLIWEKISILQIMQFPWRILFITSIIFLFISALFLDNIKINKTLLFLIVIFNIFLSLFYSKKHAIYVKVPDPYIYLESPFTTSLNDEFFTQKFSEFKSLKLQNYVGFEENVKDLNGYANINIKKWKTNYHEYEIDSTQSAYIIERLMYFPGWKTFVDGKKTEIITNNTDYPGVNTYQVSAGKHNVITKFTEDTSSRKIGDISSILSLVAILIIYLKAKKSKIKI